MSDPNRNLFLRIMFARLARGVAWFSSHTLGRLERGLWACNEWLTPEEHRQQLGQYGSFTWAELDKATPEQQRDTLGDEAYEDVCGKRSAL